MTGNPVPQPVAYRVTSRVNLQRTSIEVVAGAMPGLITASLPGAAVRGRSPAWSAAVGQVSVAVHLDTLTVTPKMPLLEPGVYVDAVATVQAPTPAAATAVCATFARVTRAAFAMESPADGNDGDCLAEAVYAEPDVGGVTRDFWTGRLIPMPEVDPPTSVYVPASLPSGPATFETLGMQKVTQSEETLRTQAALAGTALLRGPLPTRDTIVNMAKQWKFPPIVQTVPQAIAYLQTMADMFEPKAPIRDAFAEAIGILHEWQVGRSGGPV